MSEDAGRIATNLRTLLILEAVAQSSEPLTPTDINREIGLPKQSIHRLCQTLIDQGFLIRDVSGRRLQPAPRSTELARGLLEARHHSTARRQVLTTLSEATRETINFVVPEPDGMTYLDRVETDWLYRVELPIGSCVPFHCTASGKCFLASLDEDRLTQILTSISFLRRAPNTLMSDEQLRAELGRVREQGYAIDNEEMFEGMKALALPISDPQGRFIAAIAFHGPTPRLSHETLMSHLPVMRDGAAKLATIETGI